MISYPLALSAAYGIEDQLIRWRRALHQIPEVGLELPQTRAYIRGELQKLGLSAVVRESKAGIWVDIPGGQPAADTRLKLDAGPEVVLRVDMDGLAVEERTGLSFASRHPGFMHACGHDGHAAVGLGLALLLSQASPADKVWSSSRPPRVNGPVHLLFQAGEETLQGGRLATQELSTEETHGATDTHDSSLALPNGPIALSLHLDPGIPEGMVALRKGQMNARVDGISVTVTGQGGHGAYPHMASDTILAAGAFVCLAQATLSRILSPAQRAVLSFGQIRGGTAPNVIPEHVFLEGTLRTGSDDVFQVVSERLRGVAEGIGRAVGLNISVDLQEQCPAVMCHSGLTQWIRELIERGLGKDRVVWLSDILMGGDDFAFLSQIMPAAMLRVGIGNGAQSTPSLHSQQFTFNESVLVNCLALVLYIVINYVGVNDHS